MKVLTVDVGTGTQDIYLYDSEIDPENGFKLVVPSPTMMVYRRIQKATRIGDPVALSGLTMGGGPSFWAARDHAKAGYPVYATPDAGRTFNDDLEVVRESGIKVLSEDELAALPESVIRIEMRDFNFQAIARIFGEFGVSLAGLNGVAVAVFDHGHAPPGVSDRQFRFDYLAERLAERTRSAEYSPLSRLAFRRDEVPADMSRLRAVVDSAKDVDAPLLVMDTAPAAVLGALQDPKVRARSRVMIANVGNFHTLAFRMGEDGVEGLFEHHTGFLDLHKLEGLLTQLAKGSLTHQEVFGDQGHGALIYHSTPLSFGEGAFDVAVTGPRRNLMRGVSLRPYFVSPFGGMMIVGCVGLLAAVADRLSELKGPILASLRGEGGSGTPPWEVDP
jgi:uncharacterized protein (DUF1786 family)